jgi:2-aminomuconate deaminase
MTKTDSRVIEGRARPLANYPHVKQVGDWVFISGTSARQSDDSILGAEVDASGTTRLDAGLQVRATIENLRTSLKAIGADLEDLVDVTCFLVSMDDFPAFNEVYNTYFDASGPTRTTVAVHQLPHPHFLIEIKATAHKISGPETPAGDGG